MISPLNFIKIVLTLVCLELYEIKIKYLCPFFKNDIIAALILGMVDLVSIESTTHILYIGDVQYNEYVMDINFFIVFFIHSDKKR